MTLPNAMTRYNKPAHRSKKISLSEGGRSVTTSPDGTRVNAPSNSAAAPQNSAGAGGLLDDCSQDSDCGPGLACALGSCVGLPLPTVPPAVCGPHSHPSPNSIGCDCDGPDAASPAGYFFDGSGCSPLANTALPATFSNICTQTGGQWDATRPAGSECACAAGQLYDPLNGCGGTDPCYGVAEGGGCTDSSGNTGACLGGNCVIGYCIDGVGNAGIKDANGNCVAPACAPGQGRGQSTNTCMDCGINGFQPDGITCNPCPPGSSLSADGNSCVCAGNKQWNADNTACVTGATPQPNQPPPPTPVKTPPVVPCAASDTPVVNTQGVQTGCSPPKNTPPPPVPGAAPPSGNGMLYGILAVMAVGAAALIVTSSKKKGASKRSTRSHAHR